MSRIQIIAWVVTMVSLQRTVLCQLAEDARVSVDESWNVTVGDKIEVGPDPNDPVDLSKLLLQNQIQREIGLTKSQSALVKELRKRWVDLPPETIPSHLVDLNWSRLARDAVGIGLTEILNERQLLRLRELAYRYEIEVLGLGESLCQGRLNTQVGVYENQVTDIREKTRKFESEYELTVRQLSEQAEARIIALLQPDQQIMLRKLIGPYYHYRSHAKEREMVNEHLDSRDQVNRINAIDRPPTSFRSPAIGDPLQLDHLFKLLRDPQICHELQLSRDQLQAAQIVRSETSRDIRNKVLEAIRGNSVAQIRKEFDETKASIRTSIEEIVLPSQMERLKQLAYRQEIHAFGYANALTSGRLGTHMKIDSSDKTRTVTEIAKILSGIEEMIRSLEKEKEAKIVAELSTEQREKFRKTTGVFFKYQHLEIPERVGS